VISGGFFCVVVCEITYRIRYYLKTLKLPAMLREHRKTAAVCQTEGADYATYSAAADRKGTGKHSADWQQRDRQDPSGHSSGLCRLPDGI
jgi:hypothetical protein